MTHSSTKVSFLHACRGGLIALAVPLVVAGCGGAGFSQGSSEPDGSVVEAGPDGDIIVGPDGGAGHDASMPHPDASPEHDAHADAPEHEDATAGEAGPAEGGVPEAAPDAGPDAPGCPSGYLDCNGTCTQEGLANCGSCGHDCANLPHVSGGVTCGTGGVCTFTNADCAPGWAHCTGSPDNGCETSTTASPNCGGCGVTCSGNTPQCNGTMCVSGCTAPKSTLCNGTTCVDTTSDPQNCNGCGDVCTAGPANSTTTCTASKCGYQCNTSYTGCPVGAPTSCENLTDDPNNCGACAHKCNAPANGATSCVSSACAPACPGSLPDLCASEGANGTCVNFGNDTGNCGGCGNKCPGPVVGTGSATCNNTCGVTCSGSTPNACGIEPSISCVNFTDDVNNCGSCANACGKGSNKAPPSNGSSICASSTCDFQCSAGYTKCEAQWECLAAPLTGSAFVSAGSGFTPSSSGGCGTAAQPCENLSDGVAYAKAQGYANLYLAHGTTYGESDGPIVLDPTTSLTVSGGWTFSAGAWTPDCAPLSSSTIILAPAGASEAVEITGGTVTVENLTIQNSTAAGTGQSLYGVLLTGSQPLTLNNVDIQVAAGGNGSGGGTGANAQLLPTCAAGTSANGTTPGGTGSAGTASYGASGYTPGGGGLGATGSNGSNGTPASTVMNCVSSVTCREVVGNCQPNTTSSCGGLGTNGCGTTGAGGGSGGTGGGASIGIYVGSSASVTMNGGAITTGNGGTGGAGGAPGSQLAGTLGQPGNNGPTVCESDNNCGVAPTCAISCSKMGSAAGGTAGGNGGEGAAGGTGGGGSGGDSHCYATAASGAVTLATVTCTTGMAGAAGSPNGTAGSNTVHN
jgi:hypothetical protein